MILFMVVTKTQLLNAMVLASTVFADEKCDVYYSDLCKKFFSNGIEPSCFNKCYKVKKYANGSNWYRKMLGIFSGDFKNNLPNDPMIYDKVFFSGVGIRVFGFYYAIKSINQNVKLSLYEEGINEYYYMGNTHFRERILHQLIFGRYYIKDADSLYVYRPEAALNIYKNIEKKEIPSISSDKNTLQQVNSFFDYRPSSNLLEGKKVVFLEQQIDEGFQNVHELNLLQQKIVDLLVAAYGIDNIWIKLHPLSKQNKYGKKYHYLEYSAPFEVIIANEKVENVVFVSICSSAILNFKLIFDLEPCVFSFNKLAIQDGDVNRLFDYVKDNCRNNNFCILNGLQEFEALIREKG